MQTRRSTVFSGVSQRRQKSRPSFRNLAVGDRYYAASLGGFCSNGLSGPSSQTSQQFPIRWMAKSRLRVRSRSAAVLNFTHTRFPISVRWGIIFWITILPPWMDLRIVVTCSSRLWRVLNPSVSFLVFFISGTQGGRNRHARKRRGCGPRGVFAHAIIHHISG